MYLRTPKRYRAGRRRQLRLISRRMILLLIVTPLAVLAAWTIWNNRQAVRSAVVPPVETLAINVQTQIAPRPTPTATPDVQLAQAGCVSAYQQGDLEEAITQCKILAESRPNDPDLYYRVAHMLTITSNFGRNRARLDEALEYAERTINANPSAPDGWAIRAMALDWRGEYGRALASAMHARSLDENFAPAYAFLAEVYHDLGQDETALSYAEQAIALDTSGMADAFRIQGKIYSDRGEYESAIRPYQVALQQAPNHSYIAVELASNYIALGEMDQAIEVLGATLDQNPRDTSAMFVMAGAYTQSGEYDRSLEYYRRCLDADPDNIACLSYLGGLQFYFYNDYPAAIVSLERAIELGSNDPDDYLQIGQAHTALQRCDLAAPYLQQGYQMAVEREDEARMGRFANALQVCNQPVTGAPAPTSPPLPTETPLAESG
ncbi:MAG: tetratricopeptide repeat protein [Chloroflexi bacterium]|nr:tetratricopeptide repeat protein [Chloroflexota bacterium]